MNDVQAIMVKVLVALMPAAAVHVWLFGPGLLVNCALATGGGAESSRKWILLTGVPRVM